MIYVRSFLPMEIAALYKIRSFRKFVLFYRRIMVLIKIRRFQAFSSQKPSNFVFTVSVVA